MKFKHLSITGPKGQNQDAILEPYQVMESIWCGIADGVGSASRGGLAAQTSLEVVRHISNPELTMEELFFKVSSRLLELATEEDNRKSLSTTLSVLCFRDSHALVGHVGDTRISHYRGTGVMSRTKDQTEVQKLLDDGALTKNQARRYPRRNVLLSAMSPGGTYNLYQTEFTVVVGDRILLTTDGFHNKLMRGTISDISSSSSTFEEFWSSLTEALQRVDLEDDASCLAIEIDEPIR